MSENQVPFPPPTVKSNPTDEFLTKRELAERLKVSVRTLENWVARGLIRQAKIGHTVRFRWSDVVERIGSHTA